MTPIPSYRWRCLACDSVNAPLSDHCLACGCPARPRYAEIQRFARLAALRADKVFPPVDAEIVTADSRGPSPLRMACIVAAVVFSWAVVALVIQLSLAPVAGTRIGGWLLNALMVAVVLLAMLSSTIVYRSARRARSERRVRPHVR